jgi:formyltetrahydrofolate hydrolase
MTPQAGMLRAVPSPHLERPGGLDPSSCAWNFNLPMETNQRKDFERRFSAAVGEPFGMNWRLWNASGPKHIAVLVSRYDHCLRSVLARAVRWHCEHRVIVHGNSTVVC